MPAGWHSCHRLEGHVEGTRRAEVTLCMCLQGGGQLRDYQLDGLNWMVYAWSKGMNAILADVSQQRVLWCSVDAGSHCQQCVTDGTCLAPRPYNRLLVAAAAAWCLCLCAAGCLLAQEVTVQSTLLQPRSVLSSIM